MKPIFSIAYVLANAVRKKTCLYTYIYKTKFTPTGLLPLIPGTYPSHDRPTSPLPGLCPVQDRPMPGPCPLIGPLLEPLLGPLIGPLRGLFMGLQGALARA